MNAVSHSDQIFDFERDFEGGLYCIPMSTRLKLDVIGVKLSLKQWNRIPREGRQALLELPCSTDAQIEAYRESTLRLILTFTRSEPELLPVDAAPPWAQNCVPQRVAEFARGRGVRSPDSVQWQSLTAVQRFALYKLTRPGHSNDNFLPAMREFGLLAPTLDQEPPATFPHSRVRGV